MSDKSSDDQYSPDETERRMTDAIRRALNTPPKPHKEMVGKGERASTTPKSRVKKSDR
jgi:predicted oxidoreductase